MRSGSVREPVSGWRVWRVCREIDRAASAQDVALRLLHAGSKARSARGFKLRSLTELGFWPLASGWRRRVTWTFPDHGIAPAAACECGVWAFKSADRAAELIDAYRDGATAIAIGRTWMWGRLVEHRDGWRAQYAYPRELTVYGAPEPAAADLADAYRIEVVTSSWPPSARAA